MIRQLIEMSVRTKVWMCRTCKRWWGDPGYRVPTGRRMANEEDRASGKFEHGANAGISYNMHSFTGGVSRLFLRSMHFRNGSNSTGCRGSRRSWGGHSGSSGSRFEEELDEFKSLRGCRGTCGLGDGSRSGSKRNLAFWSVVKLDDPGGYLAHHCVVVLGVHLTERNLASVSNGTKRSGCIRRQRGLQMR